MSCFSFMMSEWVLLYLKIINIIVINYIFKLRYLIIITPSVWLGWLSWAAQQNLNIFLLPSHSTAFPTHSPSCSPDPLCRCRKTEKLCRTSKPSAKQPQHANRTLADTLWNIRDEKSKTLRWKDEGGSSRRETRACEGGQADKCKYPLQSLHEL